MRVFPNRLEMYAVVGDVAGAEELREARSRPGEKLTISGAIRRGWENGE